MTLLVKWAYNPYVMVVVKSKEMTSVKPLVLVPNFLSSFLPLKKNIGTGEGGPQGTCLPPHALSCSPWD